MRALAFGSYDVGTHPRVRVLVEGIRANGVDVHEINEPLGMSTAQRVKVLQQPWRLPSAGITLGSRWLRLARLGLRSRREPAPDFVLVGYLGHFDVLLARALFPRATIVLDHLIFASGTAIDRGASSWGRARLLRLVDLAALRAASVIVVDTEEHRSMVPARWRSRAVVVPVGASSDWFAAGDGPAPGPAPDGGAGGDPGDRPLEVLFFGLFTPLQGATVIARALEIVHERGVPVRVTLVGSGQDHAAVHDRLASVPWVTWRDWVRPADLPGLVAAHDVSLGIFGDTRKALDVVPNKIYQGAAAGTAVVTSDTPPQRRAFDGAAVLVPPADPEALADALERLARDPGAVVRLKAAARARATRDFAPEVVVAPLLDALGHPSPDSRPG